MSRHKRTPGWGWYHNWSLHTDVEIHWLEIGTQPDNDWYGPFKVHSEAKTDALEKAKWELLTARHQVQQIQSLRKLV